MSASWTPFNSRPHKEVDTAFAPFKTSFIPFQFTTSQGGRPLRRQQTASEKPFNSRPHKEVDSGFKSVSEVLQPFNSRPHKEVDDLVQLSDLKGELSIHDLTRRSTGYQPLNRRIRCLSIHDLTRRSTVISHSSLCILSLSIHDLTRRST